MVPRIVPAYAALLALLFIYLAVRVMQARGRAGVSIGTGGDRPLERRMRVHANFAEYTPIALILLALMEIEGSAAWYLHLLCLSLLAGRIAHAYGVSREPDVHAARGAGMVLTFVAIILPALTLLARAL
jgi:uncharacterized protein